jgi:hypothetical protein
MPAQDLEGGDFGNENLSEEEKKTRRLDQLAGLQALLSG